MKSLLVAEQYDYHDYGNHQEQTPSEASTEQAHEPATEQPPYLLDEQPQQRNDEHKRNQYQQKFKYLLHIGLVFESRCKDTEKYDTCQVFSEKFFREIATR